MDERCVSCQHWATEEATADYDAAGFGMRECLAVKPRWEIADAATSNLSRWGADEEENLYVETRAKALQAAKAYVEDGSEYRARMVTGPDFGCVLHEPV